MKREVKIKPWPVIEAISHSSNEICFFAPVGQRHPYLYAIEAALPENRIIGIQSDNTWHIGGILFKIGDWVIEKVMPDAIEDQAQAHGEGRLQRD